MKQIILLLALIFIESQTILSQPQERLKNRYKEPNMSYGAPYTMFDIADHANDKTIGIVNKIQEIRILISVTGPYKNIYSEIYTNYWNTPNPSPGNKEDKDYDPLATFAKNKAFIALVGVDPDGVPLPQTTITRLKNEAYYALQNMNTDVVNYSILL